MNDVTASGHSAIVTGAAGLLGISIVHALVRSGFRVGAVDRSDSSRVFPDQVASGSVVPLIADLADSAERVRVIDEARARLSKIRVLVNNAADGSTTPLLESTDDHWRSVLETNLVAPAALTRLLFSELKGLGGVVVNLGSVRGIASLPGGAAYEASKGGIHALTRAAASELGQHGIRVVTVCPGAIGADPSTWLDGMAEGVQHAWAATQPMGRAGSPDAIGNVVAFLCSVEASHINGVEIVVDGGAIAQYPATAALRMGGALSLP